MVASAQSTSTTLAWGVNDQRSLLVAAMQLTDGDGADGRKKEMEVCWRARETEIDGRGKGKFKRGEAVGVLKKKKRKIYFSFSFSLFF